MTDTRNAVRAEVLLELADATQRWYETELKVWGPREP